MKNILVTGATGTLGRALIKQLLDQHFRVNALSSRQDPALPQEIKIYRGDLVTNSGLAEAVNNNEVIIHCASDPANHRQVDVIGTRNLLDAIGKKRGIHFIYISIVGVDKSDYPYYKTKKETEDMIREHGLPWSVLRTTQFHAFVLKFIGSFNNGNEQLMTIPGGMRFQSVDLAEVAGRLTELIKEGPQGLLPAMGGPEVLSFEEMMEKYLQISGQNNMVQVRPLRAERYDLFRSGVNLCPEHAGGKITWEQYLRLSLPLKDSAET
jgi:uncharacterized protein YbjT (DUF2867 family)